MICCRRIAWLVPAFLSLLPACGKSSSPRFDGGWTQDAPTDRGILSDGARGDAEANHDAKVNSDAKVSSDAKVESDAKTSPDATVDPNATCPANAAAVNVCGCGCCGGGPASTGCYYPELGQTAASVPNPTPSASTCATAGCSAGVHYVCCAAPGTATTGGYCLHDLATDLPRYGVIKSDGAVCTTLVLLGAQLSPNLPDITAPPSYEVSGATRGPCDGSTAPVSAIGGLGSVTFAGSGTARFANVHLTLFFPGTSGAAEAVHFDADSLPFSAGCPN